MSIRISCGMYLRLGLHVKIRLYYVLTTYMSQVISKYTEHLGIISCTTTCMLQVISKYTEHYGIISCTATCKLPRPGGCGERVRLVTWWLQVRSPVEATFLFGVSSPLTSAKHVRKVVGGFGKKSCVSTGVREPENTCASPTAMI